MLETKLYIGPMTKNVTDAIIKFTNENNINIGLIPSRRQIEYNGGYVGWNTNEFVNYVRGKSDNIILERDHSGAGQGEEFDDGFISQKHDALNNFDIIHIDPWKTFKNYKAGLKETIDNILSIYNINKNCKFEVGTEEAIRKFEVEEFDMFITELKRELGKVFDNVIYGVIQSGTRLLETKNIGNFDVNKCKEMSDICHNHGILSKEHNGDYLSKEDIKLRFNNGLNAINIAPEYGVFETNLILEKINEDQFNEIYEVCYNSNKWIKWVDNNFKPEENKEQLIKICGHYVNNELKTISNIDDEYIINEIVKKIKYFYE